MDAKQRANVEKLIEKAANATHAPEAVNFAQAACNAANALRGLMEIDRTERGWGSHRGLEEKLP